MAQNTAVAEHYVGVDLAGPRLLAGGFNRRLQLLGKSKFSPKPERGPQVVIDRVARCIRDAVDECDLPQKQIKAVGLAVPGTVDISTGRVLSAPSLGWTDLPLKQELEKRLEIPVVLENDCHVAALGIYTQELSTKPKAFVAVFPDRPGVVGVLIDGRFSVLPSILQAPVAQFPTGSKPLPPRNPAKQLRKAIQAGDAEAEKAALEIARRTGIFVASLINVLRPDILALGGGAMEELKDWMLPVIQKQVEELVELGQAATVDIVVSELGKDAGIVGGAVLAAQQGAA